MQTQLDKANEQITQVNSENASLGRSKTELSIQLGTLRYELTQSGDNSRQLSVELASKDDQIATLATQVIEHLAALGELKNKAEAREERLVTLQTEVEKKDTPRYRHVATSWRPLPNELRCC